jgi:hypothetical protein
MFINSEDDTHRCQTRKYFRSGKGILETEIKELETNSKNKNI